MNDFLFNLMGVCIIGAVVMQAIIVFLLIPRHEIRRRIRLSTDSNSDTKVS
jgi:hypothetical protein